MLSKVLRCVKYAAINSSQPWRAFLEAFANPYPGKSTNYHSLLISKWLISCVLPGVPEVFAKFF